MAIPRSCARCSRRGRSSPSPTSTSSASIPRSRAPVSIVSRSSVRLTAVIRPNQPTTNFSAGIPCRRRTSAGSPSKSTRGSSSIPSRTTENLLSGATRSRTSSSRTSGLTAISRSEIRARAVSIARKRSAPAAPKYPRSTWPWNVWTMTGPPARQEGAHSPDRAGLRRVRVDDVRTNLADDAREAPRRERVAQRRQLARQPAQRNDVDARPAPRRTPSTPRRVRRRPRRAWSRIRGLRARGPGT